MNRLSLKFDRQNADEIKGIRIYTKLDDIIETWNLRIRLYGSAGA